jgi:hypothetical protein
MRQGWSARLFHASQQWSTISSWEVNTRLDDPVIVAGLKGFDIEASDILEMLTIACPPSHIIGIGLIIPDGNTDIAHGPVCRAWLDGPSRLSHLVGTGRGRACRDPCANRCANQRLLSGMGQGLAKTPARYRGARRAL